MDDKTQQYIAKMVDMTQVAQYLDRYTKSINRGLVPVLRQLILQVKQGITHHTDEVTKNVYTEMQKITGTSMKGIIEQETYKELRKDADEVHQAKLSAQLAAGVAQNAVNELSPLLSSFFDKVETRKFGVNFRNLYSLWLPFSWFGLSMGTSL